MSRSRSDIRPPEFYQKLLRHLCNSEYLEELEGDLDEKFQEHLKEHGIEKARKRYRNEVIKMIRPSVWKSSWQKKAQSLSPMLLGSQFKILARNIRRQWAFSFINIVGLALSMAIGILVITMLFELQRFDDFHESPDDVFRVITHRTIGTNTTPLAASPAALSHAMLEELPQIQAATKLNVFHKKAYRQKHQFNISGLYADTSFFKVLNFPLTEGNVQLLNQPGSIFITEKLSKKLFRDGKSIGQELTIEGEGNFLIRGILRDLPKNTHLKFEALIPFSHRNTAPESVSWTQNWTNTSSVITYIRKESAGSSKDIQAWLDSKTEDQYTDKKVKVAFELQPLQKAITGRQLSHQPGTVIPSVVIFILSGVAIAIVLAGCFNYTNLSIARALSRMKEVGVRKTIGGSRLQIFFHYLSETVLLAILAFLLALVIFLLIKPYFLKVFWMMESLFDLELTVSMIFRSFLFSLLVGIIAGLYPAMVYAKINTLSALKGNATVKLSLKKGLRNSLIVIQFSLVFAFVLVSHISKKQYAYIDKLDKGFDLAGLVSLPLKGNDPKLLASAFLSIPGVENVNFTSTMMGGPINKVPVTHAATRDTMSIRKMAASDGFLSTYKITLLAGDSIMVGSNSVLINKRLATYLTQGEPTEAIGEVLVIDGKSYHTVGVTEDFMFGAQQDRVAPLIIAQTSADLQYATLRFGKPLNPEFYEQLDSAWKTVDAQNLPEPVSLALHYSRNIQFFKEMIRATGYLGLSLIVISGLGLLAITGYQLQLRQKDLSLRRVLGARPYQLLSSISAHFIMLLSIAATIGVSAAWFLLDSSLIDMFYYRIQIGMGELLPGVIFVFTTSGLFISSQILRVIRINPAILLRQE
ncbi:MAG: FtsX-like permease family protein [Roseivirga sp.]|nr:FtsX-like permease family protein [Roseivirga sp.]